MRDYYSRSLSAERLKKCYDIVTPRMKQYLDSELQQVRETIKKNDRVLELGCGYGRTIKEILTKTQHVVGIDSSIHNIQYAKEYLRNKSGWEVFLMNAVELDFEDNSFDVVVCIQNGLSAFHEDPERIVSEALRVTKKSGRALFSTYAEKFWNERLQWFKDQSALGLLGEIDVNKTGNGVIICKDGFTARTFSEEDFRVLARKLDITIRLYEIDNSSLFCEIIK